ncbi:hypothetical protein [Neptuniibacter caesariensis]|uniref:Uncharacterized protein n=1 Tax=Neptuniibacter caesariensis TaxID=207954 RepID=A0A7U8GSG9_NEPCE|nr:hypothetical protein [Neptuniibacter caesariensis]EAR61318.1 hypothetical protein MED92_11344 [Oceanospirillum sp. MED92] [Neptuniibacter caesariensis]
MKSSIHKAAAVVATLCIVAFFTSTVISELFFDLETVARVKSLIVLPGLFILIPAIAITGATGFAMAKKTVKGVIGQKKKRMPFIGVNGVLILVPCAIFLNLWASAGQFDTTFYVVQAIEIIAGATNIFLMALNIRDGRKLTRR